MSIKNNKKLVKRNADLIVNESQHEVGDMSLVGKGQVKLWKALIASFFVVSFVGTLALMAGTKIGSSINTKTNASTVQVGSAQKKDNIAPMMKMNASAFALGESGYGWGNLVDGELNQNDKMVVARIGGNIPVEFSFPAGAPQRISGFAFDIDPDNTTYPECGLKDFSVEYSIDGKNYTALMEKSLLNSSGFQYFDLNENSIIQSIRFLLKTNHGNPNWLCIQELNIYR